MNDLKKRLIEEQAQLELKVDKLRTFNASKEADKLDPLQKQLLLIQAGAMYTYNECLKTRIATLKL